MEDQENPAEEKGQEEEEDSEGEVSGSTGIFDLMTRCRRRKEGLFDLKINLLSGARRDTGSSHRVLSAPQ